MRYPNLTITAAHAGVLSVAAPRTRRDPVVATARRMAARHQRARPSLPVESGTAACPHASESRARPPLRDRPVGAARDPRDAGRPRGRRADADRPRCRPYRGRGLRLAGRTRRRDRPCRHLDRHRDRPWPDRAGHRADQRARRSGVARPVAAGQPLECVRNRTRRDARFTGAARGAFREVDTPHAGRWRLLDIPLSGPARPPWPLAGWTGSTRWAGAASGKTGWPTAIGICGRRRGVVRLLASRPDRPGRHSRVDACATPGVDIIDGSRSWDRTKVVGYGSRRRWSKVTVHRAYRACP